MNIFYFVSRWPRNMESSRSEKAYSLIESLINLGHQVTLFSPDSTSIDSQQDLDKIPMDKIFISPTKIGSSIASSAKKPNLVIFNNYQMEQMYSIFLYTKWNKCPRILEINQLSGLQNWRKKNYLTLSSPFLHEYDAPSYPQQSSQRFTEQQLQSIKRSDYYFCGNDYISYYVKKHLNLSSMIIHSMGRPITNYLTSIADLQYREYRHREHFVFVGNFIQDKNVEMINILITNIWPVIRKQLKNVELHIYGSGYNKTLQAKKKDLEKQGVFIRGKLEDINDIQKYRAFLYPVQYTTGTKGSIVQSWLQQTPVVTTPIGAEGLFMETSQPIFSANQKGQVFGGFFKEKVLTKQQQSDKKKLLTYYNLNKLSQEHLSHLSFGGLFNSFTYLNFAQNAIKLYTDQKLWNQCLLNSRTSFLKHHSELQLQVNLGFGISQVELAVHQSRRKKQYSEEWDKFIKSKDGYSKLHEKKIK